MRSQTVYPSSTLMATERYVFNGHSKMSVHGRIVAETTTAAAAAAAREQSSVRVCVCSGTRPGFSGPDRLWLIKPPSDAGGQDNNYSSGDTLCLHVYNVDTCFDFVRPTA